MGKKYTTRELDEGQLEIMWNFLKMNPRKDCIKSDVREMKSCLEIIRQALIQKTAGQRSGKQPAEYVNFEDVGTYINNVVVLALWMYVNGGLEKLEDILPEEVKQ